MAKTIDEIAGEYLAQLKGLRPEADVDQDDSDWWIRSRVVGGVIAGAYADQEKSALDAFPQAARREALLRHIFTYFNETQFTPATVAIGTVTIPATNGSNFPQGSQLTYEPSNTLYVTTEAAVATSGLITVPIQSVNAGQANNLQPGAQLTVPSPPPGVTNTATVDSDGVRDGRNEETETEAADRILTFIRSPSKGGHEDDYKLWALEADPSVVSATVERFPRGLGTVGVIITAGTTNIDDALDNGLPIVLSPSPTLVTLVGEYIETKKPLTDCVSVSGAVELPINVSISARFSQGNITTVLSNQPNGQTLNLGQLVAREAKRAIYKTPPGGTVFTGVSGGGFVVASALEEQIDLQLSSNAAAPGLLYQVLTDRQVGNLSLTGANLRILSNQVAIPGVITVYDMTFGITVTA